MRIQSEGNGYCDCGNPDSIHPDSFCSKHCGLLEENLRLSEKDLNLFHKSYFNDLQNTLFQHLHKLAFHFYYELVSKLSNENFLFSIYSNYKNKINENILKVNLNLLKKLDFDSKNVDFLFESIKREIFGQILEWTRLKRTSTFFNQQYQKLYGISQPKAWYNPFTPDPDFQKNKNQLLQLVDNLNNHKVQADQSDLNYKTLLDQNNLPEALIKRADQLIDSLELQSKPNITNILSDPSLRDNSKSDLDTDQIDLIVSLMWLLTPSFEKDLLPLSRLCIQAQEFHNFKQFMQQKVVPQVWDATRFCEKLDSCFEDLLTEMKACSQFQFLFHKLFTTPLHQNPQIPKFLIELLCQLELIGFDFLSDSVRRMATRQGIRTRLEAELCLNDLISFYDLCSQNRANVAHFDELIINLSANESFASSFNLANLRQSYLMSPFLEKKSKSKSVIVTRLGTLGLTTEYLFSKNFQDFELYSGFFFMKMIHERLVEIFGQSILETDLNGEQFVPVQIRLVDKAAFLSGKLTRLYKELKYIHELTFKKNVPLYFQKIEYLRVFIESVFKLDMIRFDMDFWDSDLNINVRREFYIEMMGLQEELKDNILFFLKMHLVYKSLVIYDAKDLIELIASVLEKKTILERDPRVQRIVQNEGDSCNADLISNSYFNSLITEIFFSENEISILANQKRRSLTSETVYQRIKEFAPFANKNKIQEELSIDMASLDKKALFASIQKFSKIKSTDNENSENSENKLSVKAKTPKRISITPNEIIVKGILSAKSKMLT